ncbi:hypothetical protein EDC19_2508 [Natranaerovirga hydrolytica]|uniref:MerR-like DNA binding protein n=1 Tax=Natranaerovirga hydrolytica TaxID=680378 RepID=A0A4R1MDI6_9FIRM|nr:hypothetical protein [Natranaerovirga hydrolytica]TCK89094.1 hypothetical protein EDC19_2508 [Natranaerovirga hydrolytica]
MKPAITDEALIQNLKDAGCAADFIQGFIKHYQQGETPEALRHDLSKQRRLILDKVHESQRQLDCLDYLIYQLKK